MTEEEEEEAYAEFESAMRKVALVQDVIDSEDVIMEYALIGYALDPDSALRDSARYFFIYPGGTLMPHVAAGLHTIWGRQIDDVDSD